MSNSQPKRLFFFGTAACLLVGFTLINEGGSAQTRPNSDQPELTLKDRRGLFDSLTKLQIEVDAMKWRQWDHTPKTTWDPDVDAKGWYRQVGNSVELIVEIVPTRSSEGLSPPNQQRRLAFDLPKLDNLVPSKAIPYPLLVGPATYWRTGPAGGGGVVGSVFLYDS